MNMMNRYIIISLTAIFLFSLSPICNAQVSLDGLLKPYLSRYDLPAIAAAVVKNGKIIAAGAVGTRRTGVNIPVTIHDRFHLGSDTKAMTALLLAMQVEKGKIKWDSTLAEIFPELVSDMNSDLPFVTIEQLLSHTSGIGADNADFGNLLNQSMSQTGNLDELRYWLLSHYIKLPLESQPGSKFVYANMNYVIAGAVIERLEEKTWDELMVENIFYPLQLKTAGLGQQASLGKIDAPLGHAIIDNKVTAILPGPCSDNPAIIGPAGIAHMSILDFARWAAWNAAEGKRGPRLVQPETMKKLHTPVVTVPDKKDAAPGTPSHGRYALGWGEVSVDWAPYPLVYHSGSNNMNLAHIWLDTKRDIAMVITTNISGPRANEAIMNVAAKLYLKYNGK